MEQRVATPFQQNWITKLIGYNYEIVYRNGKENKAVDALSRREDLLSESVTLHALSSIATNWLAMVRQSRQLIADLTKDENSHACFLWDNGVLTHKGCLVIGVLVDSRNKIIAKYQNIAVGGHSVIDKTTRRIKRTFYWKGLKKDV